MVIKYFSLALKIEIETSFLIAEGRRFQDLFILLIDE